MASYLTYRNVLVSNSTVNASTLNASAVTFSTLTVGSTITTSSLVASALNASAVNFSTLTGSTMTTSTLTASTLTASSITVKSLTVASTVLSLGLNTTQSFNGTSGAYNWSSTLTGGSTYKKLAMSQSGQYQMVVQTSSTINTSADSGITWASLTGSNGLPTGSLMYAQTPSGAPAYTSLSESANGQYALAAVSGGGLYLSNNANSATPLFSAVGLGQNGNPFLYLPFENSTADIMGNSAVTPSGSIAYVTGKVGTNAVNLVNTAGSGASNYLRGAWTGSNAFTVSGWFNAQTIAGGQDTIVSAYNGGFVLYINASSQIQLYVPTSTSGINILGSPPTITTNTWYSFTCIYQLGGVCSFYLNNVLLGTVTSTANVYTTTLFSLGTYDMNQTAAFNGYIDDFRIYNYAVPNPSGATSGPMPASGVITSPTIGTGAPTIYLPLDGSTADVMGYSTVTATGSMAYVTGIVGSQALNLVNTMNGNNATNYISASWSGSANYTVSFWFRIPAYSTSQQTIFSAYAGSTIIYIIPTSNLLSIYIPSGGGTSTTNYATTGFSIALNTWYYVTSIFQTGGLCSLSVNNVLIGSTTNSSGVGTYTTTSFRCGTYDTALSNAFSGYIDDFRLYSCALPFSPITTANWSQTAVSATGQYMLAAASGGGLFFSSTYGQTWTQVSTVLNGGLWNSVSLSQTGQYALATTSAATVTPQLTGLAANTWSVNGITWAASASSSYLGASNPTYYPALGAFNNYSSGNTLPTTPYSWGSAALYSATSPFAYTGAVTVAIQGVGTIYGEWLQLQTSVPLVMSTYTFACGGYLNLPQKYWIIGSNDNVTWYPIQYASMTTTPLTANFHTPTTYLTVNQSGTQTVQGDVTGSGSFTAYATSTQAYTYFRIMATNLFGNGTLFELGEWYINFVGGLAYSTNYGQTWSNAVNAQLTDYTALSGNGQYIIGLNNQLVPSAYLPLDNSTADSRGALTYVSTGAGGVTYSSSIVKVGTYSAYFANTAGASGTSYLNYSNTIGTPSALTLSLWVYPTANPASGASCPFSLSSAATAGPYFSVLSTGIVNFAYYTTSSNGSISSLAAITLNSWSHLVGVFSSGSASFYVNGALQGSAAIAGNLSLNGGGSIVSAYLGCVYPAGYQYAGYVDDVRIYTAALNPTLITLLYNNPPLLGASLGTFSGLNATYAPITLTGINAALNCASVSTTGQYMVILTQGTSNNVYYSTNYGQTFTALTVGSAAMATCAISADGSYLTVSNATTVYTLNRNAQGFTVALGANAGAVNQASNAIAIGNQAGQTNQTANSIVLNASGAAVNPYTQGFYVAPIAPVTQSTAPFFPLLGYGSDSQVVQSSTGFTTTQQTYFGEWIQYQLATASPITSYTLQGRQVNSARYPIAWVIVGSTDGSNWTLLDSQTGAGWGTYPLKGATAAYLYYRIVYTQVTTASSGYIDTGGLILSNGTPLFGSSANYTVAAGPNNYYNVLQSNGVTVCTTTFSWPNTTSANAVGIAASIYPPSSYPNAMFPTSDWWSLGGGANFISFHIFGFGASYEYNAAGIATQGTSTIVNTTTLSNVAMAGTLTLASGSQVGIGSTVPAYALDVVGTAQVNGVWGVSDTVAPSANAYTTFGQTWNAIASSQLSNAAVWIGCAVSATGQYMTASIYNTPPVSGANIYYSTNYGSTWSLATGFLANAAYARIGMSGNGQYQIASIDTASAALYVSSNYGATWSATSYTIGSSAYGRNGALSYNGQYQYVAIGGTGNIAISSNYGATFANSTAISTGWSAVCCSTTGQYVFASANGGYLWYSTNYGQTWIQSGSASAAWYNICCSASGQYVIAAVTSGYIYYSNNYGVNWTQSSSISANWYSVSCSSSGQYVIATAYNGYIYYSTNYGVTWSVSGSASAYWQICAMSQNGLYTLAVVNGGAVYLSSPANVGLVTNGFVGVGTSVPGTNLHISGPPASGGAIGQLIQKMNTVTVPGKQYGQSAGFALCGGILTSDSYGRLDVLVNSTAAAGNNYGQNPNTMVASFCGNGLVGIGTTTPAATLQINDNSVTGSSFPLTLMSPNLTAGGNQYILFGTSGSNANQVQFGFNYVGSGSASNYAFIQTYGVANIMCWRANGYVGIGITNPSYPLHVVGSATPGSNFTGYFFNTVQNIAYSAGYSFNRSIYATSGIVSGDYVGTASDSRIKKNIIPLSNSLSILQGVDIVSYDKIDYREKGADAGVIAQQIQYILPRSIIKDERIIPNIYSTATHSISNGIVTILVSCTHSDIKEGSTVRIIVLKGEKEENHETTMINWTGSSFDVNPWSNYVADDKVFVYGTKIDDFLSVDKEQIGMLAAGGVKELHQQVLQQQQTIATQQQQLTELQTQLAAVMAKLGM